ncbi:MAG: tetraacyldisaccharide 4'-kinase [Pseudomonadota bacterium]
MSEAPPFWYKKPGIAAVALAPFGWVYGAVSSRRMAAKAGYVSDLPVFCIGNFLVGGAGKTPTALAVADMARTMGLKPAFLSRGYGGSVSSPTQVDLEKHNARDVGDEPLLLAKRAPTVVSPNRAEGAKLLEEQGVNFIIMDDGFQNPALHKDFSLVVVDARRTLGNGFTIPAGPMRAPLRAQLPQASALLVIGASDKTGNIVRQAARRAKPTLSARLVVQNAAVWKGRRVLAFAGIADPQKFYESARSMEVELVATRAFPDHGLYTADDCEQLMQQADADNLTLITTAKDAARLRNMGKAQEQLLERSHVVDVKLEFEAPRTVEGWIKETVEASRKRRLQKVV